MKSTFNMNIKDVKAGDKVKVKTDLIVGKRYGGITLLESMAKYRGHIYTVEKVNSYCVFFERH